MTIFRKTLPKSLLSSTSDFVFFEFGKKYVCSFSDMDFGGIVLKLPGELERIVQNIFHKDEWTNSWQKILKTIHFFTVSGFQKSSKIPIFSMSGYLKYYDTSDILSSQIHFQTFLKKSVTRESWWISSGKPFHKLYIIHKSKSVERDIEMRQIVWDFV